MNNNLVRNGFKLILISIIYRIIAFALFSVSWQWVGAWARVIEVMIGIIFVGIWFGYGFKLNLGFTKGLIVGLIGAADAILLTILSLILYLNRSSYYFGPIEMAFWNIPLMGISNLIIVQTEIFTYLPPFLVILLAGLGSAIRKDNNLK